MVELAVRILVIRTISLSLTILIGIRSLLVRGIYWGATLCFGNGSGMPLLFLLETGLIRWRRNLAVQVVIYLVIYCWLINVLRIDWWHHLLQCDWHVKRANPLICIPPCDSFINGWPYIQATVKCILDLVWCPTYIRTQHEVVIKHVLLLVVTEVVAMDTQGSPWMNLYKVLVDLLSCYWATQNMVRLIKLWSIPSLIVYWGMIHLPRLYVVLYLDLLILLLVQLNNLITLRSIHRIGCSLLLVAFLIVIIKSLFILRMGSASLNIVVLLRSKLLLGLGCARRYLSRWPPDHVIHHLLVLLADACHGGFVSALERITCRNLVLGSLALEVSAALQTVI